MQILRMLLVINFAIVLFLFSFRYTDNLRIQYKYIIYLMPYQVILCNLSKNIKIFLCFCAYRPQDNLLTLNISQADILKRKDIFYPKNVKNMG